MDKPDYEKKYFELQEQYARLRNFFRRNFVKIVMLELKDELKDIDRKLLDN